MNQYVTGAMIRKTRESRGITQQQLAERIGVTGKAVSRWETGRGYPDITLIEPLAAALGVSVTGLFSGEETVNTNRAFNMRRTKLYVCPVCGNIIHSTGEAAVSCCGIALPAQEAGEPDETHPVRVERVEDEYLVTVSHDMSRTHHISFIAALKDDGTEFVKLYPEGNAEARFGIARTRKIFFYCNRHGLFSVSVTGKGAVPVFRA